MRHLASVMIKGTTFAIGTIVLLVSIRVAGQSEGQALHVFVGKSVVINLQSPVTRILSSNPTVIDTLATSPTQVVVEGKTPGASSLILWDSSGHSQMLDVSVDVNVSRLREAIEQTYPSQHISVQSDGAHLLLTGNVSDPKISEDVGKLANQYSSGVVNSLTVVPIHEKQILLEVKFAEVDRTKLQELGINFFSTGAANTVGTVSTQQFSPPILGSSTGGGGGGGGGGISSSSLSISDPLNIFAFRPDINLGATIRDLQTKSVLQILAEPNLLAMNAQKASFLAGGEFPFPVVQGGQNIGVVTIQFRPFGVRLEFQGYLGEGNVVRLHIVPEVSTLDFSNAVTISGFTVPALSTRRAETEIELKDGQSFGIAGLLDNRAQVQFSKIPGIGDIPVLGNLFRSRSINRSNSELLVLVTPRIVDPTRTEIAPKSAPTNPIKFLDNPGFDKDMPARAKEPSKNVPSNETVPGTK